MLARTTDMTSAPAVLSACLLSSLDTWATWLSISRSSLSISVCWAAWAASDTVNLTRSGCWHPELGAVLASDLGPGLRGAGGGSAWDCDFFVDGLDF